MKILVVEDDYELARSLKQGLEIAAYTTTVVHDGDSGLAHVLSDNYDLAIVDWMLPGLNGAEICQNAREQGLHLPILILTARDSSEAIVEGLDAGADDYLVKPFAFAVLLARMRALLRRPSQSLPIVLSVGNISIDSATKRVMRSGKPIALSRREFAILELLMRQPTIVHTKEQIISNICDDDADVLFSTVESHVANLRAKLDKPFDEPPVIRTVWGSGYKIEDALNE